MLKLARIVRDYQDAGSVNSLLAPWGFIDDQTFLTKAGHVGLVFRLTGVDYECLDLAARRDIAHRFEASLRVLDDHYRVYQYLCKRRIDPIEAAPCTDAVANEAIQRRAAFLNERRRELYQIDLYLGARPSNRCVSHITSCCAPTKSVAALGEGRVRRVPEFDERVRPPIRRRGDTASECCGWCTRATIPLAPSRARGARTAGSRGPA